MAQIITSKGGGGGGGGGASYTAGTGIDITSNVISVDEAVVQTVGNMVDNLTGADDEHYPTAKAVADAISGGGDGDMLKSVYDPNNVNANAFDYNNFINTPTVNVKGFILSSTSDLTTAQAAYDWYKNGKTPVVRYDGGDYLVEFADSSKVILCSTGYHKEIETSYNGRTQNNLLFNLSSDTVTSINTSYGGNLTMYYLSPVVNYGTPYTPQYDGSPATKKYVDDNKTTVVDALNSTSTTSALSANQGKVLDDKIAALFGLGKFLSLWDATTGQPISFPLQTPYTYTTGDYFLVETISSATPPVNYKPTGSSYTGTASSTTETEELEVGDIYIYDGTNWLLQLNHGKTVSFSEIAGQPTDNANLSTALSAKANDNEVVKLTGDQTIAGTKTFSTSPVVPSKTADATNTGTAIATEAQVYKKQDALTLPATPTQGNLVTWGADNETFTDGGAVPTGVPSGGTNGDVLTNVSGTPTWQAPAATGIVNDTTGTTTTVTKIWAGTEAEYALITPASDTIYYVF